MSERLRRIDGEKQEVLKRIIRDLHAGVPVEKLQKTFADIVKHTSPEEIASMENALIEEGFPPDEIKRLCDVHVKVFEKSLAKAGKPAKIPGHPVYTFMQENKIAKGLLKELSGRAKRLDRKEPRESDVAAFAESFARFREIEKHYARKENQLFPALEHKGFTGPTKVMWGKHDEIRQLVREADALAEGRDWKNLRGKIKSLEGAVKKMIFLEEKILYPTAARKLGDVEWATIKRGEPEIGYAWVTPSNLWDAEIAKALAAAHVGAAAAEPGPVAPGPGADAPAAVAHEVKLSEGRLTGEQIDLLLKALPFDVTFVDEHDVVRYYSATEHRIFPRSPAIIGRAVQNCHPHKSVNVVNDIVKSFREKKKSVAEFWIRSQGAFIHIRYFPLYDAGGAYRGVIEVSQEISGIRALEGERRLLDW
jgi:DUF438 domain-containing protein